MMFYKETNFKETPIGRLPKEWEVVRLKDVAQITQGFAFSSKEFRESGIPLLRISNIKDDGKIKFNKDDTVYLPEAKLNEISKSLILKPGDIIIALSGATTGKVGMYDLPFSSLLNQRVAKIQSINKINQIFLYYTLFSKSKELLNKAYQMAQPNLSSKNLESLKISIPSIHEQQKIAEILSTLDEAIQKTNEIIAKTERLKKGLMQELLTKGIGHKEFKDTEIGRIPREWEVVKLKDIAIVIMGQSPPSSTYNKKGIGLPFLQGKMEFGSIYPSPVIYCSEPIKIAEAKDVLISVRAPVGDVNLVPYKLCIGRGLASIRFNCSSGNFLFYFYYLQKIKSFLETIGKGSTFKAIVKEDLENLKLPYLSLDEQQKIAEILFTIDKKLELEKNEKAKLERIKQGLMDLLLTGKIRVKVK